MLENMQQNGLAIGKQGEHSDDRIREPARRFADFQNSVRNVQNRPDTSDPYRVVPI